MASSNNPQHESLASGRWFTLSLAEQLGNIGSEFSRAESAKKLGNSERFNKAESRFYELMDLTLADDRWRGAPRRELARVREDAAGELAAPGTRPTLQKYFDYFAIEARANR